MIWETEIKNMSQNVMITGAGRSYACDQGILPSFEEEQQNGPDYQHFIRSEKITQVIDLLRIQVKTIHSEW